MNNRTACRSLKLPFSFDSALLLRDLSYCEAQTWKDHFNKRDYSGEWNSIALYSASGEPGDILTESSAGFKPTPLLEHCPYLKTIITSFQCEKESVRLLRLAPGSVIHEHRDNGLAYEFGIFRLHIPLVTSSGIDFVVGGERIDMKSGECWYANFDLPHAVNNPGAAARVHLVVDCKRNEWSDELFRNAGYDFQLEKKMLEPDDETKRRMMAELMRIDTETSRKLVQRLKKELNEE